MSELIGASEMRRTWLSQSRGSVERLLLLRMGKRQSDFVCWIQGRRNMAGDMVDSRTYAVQLTGEVC